MVLKARIDWLPLILIGSLCASALAAGTGNPTAAVRISVDSAVQSTRLVRKMPAIPISADPPVLVRLRVVIDVEGHVMEASAAPGTDPAIARSAIAAVRRWLYEPLVRDGHPVEVVTEVDVPFLSPKPPQPEVAPHPLEPEFLEIQSKYLARRDFRHAFPLLLKLAGQGYAPAAAKVASLYFEARGVARDVDQAVRWWQLAAGQGDIGAQHTLGTLYLFGTGGVPRQPDEGIRLLEAAGSQGHLQTQMLLGALYSGQDGFPPHPREAVRWYLLAAQRGHLAAQRALGRAYLALTPPEPEQAVSWLRSAAQLGDRRAMHDLAQLYEDGGTGTVDRVEAYVWYRRANPDGFPPAIRRLSAVMTEAEASEAQRRLAGSPAR